jgi:methylase of polypeptide subunit release factors
VTSALRDALIGAGYTDEGLRRALGPSPGIGPRHDREVYLRRLGNDKIGTLARLFWVGVPVDEEDLRRAIEPVEIATLVEDGLVELREGRAQPTMEITVYEGLYVLSDLDDAKLRPEYVTGINRSARLLADLTIRRPVRSTLDLGTGSGIQGFLASRHSEHVVAVDMNTRALASAELNAQLNEISGFETRAGSWFEPVHEPEFDLIVANPPFAVSPDTDLAYRDSELPADEVSLSIVRGAAERLAEDGYAHVECNWVHPLHGDWREPLESAFAGADCDAVLLKFETFDSLEYAASWTRVLEELGPFRVALDRWLDYYRRAGIDAVSWGVVILRRRSLGRNWVRAFEVPAFPARAAGSHVERLFTAKDYLRGVSDDDELLDAVFALPDGVRFEHHFGPDEPGHALVLVPDSVGFSARIAPDAAQAIARCDGELALGELGGDRATVATGARRLLELGFLEPRPH